MLGTGIASADENVNPDRPASPLDPQVDVPHVIAPLKFARAAAGGDAVNSMPGREHGTDSPVWTSGPAGVLAGNAVNLDWALPIRIGGNAIAAVGKATARLVSESTTGVDSAPAGQTGKRAPAPGKGTADVSNDVAGPVEDGTMTPAVGLPGSARATVAKAVGAQGSAATSDRGSISGNLADVPVNVIAQIFADPGAAPSGTGSTKTIPSSSAGGTLSGLLPVGPAGADAPVFGDAVPSVGATVAVAPNGTTAGDDTTTDGEFGSISGTLPTAPVGQVPGDVVAGSITAITPNRTTDPVGGTHDSTGAPNAPSGAEPAIPVGPAVRLFDIPVPVLAHAMAASTSTTAARIDDTAPIIDLVLGGGGLAATQLPRLPHLPTKRPHSDLPVDPTSGSGLDIAGLPESGRRVPGPTARPGVGGDRPDGVHPPSEQEVSGGSAFDGDVTQTLPVLSTTELSLTGERSRPGVPVDPTSGSGLDIAGVPDDRPLTGPGSGPAAGGDDLRDVTPPSVEVTGGDAFDGDVTQTLPVLPTPAPPAPTCHAPNLFAPTGQRFRSGSPVDPAFAPGLDIAGVPDSEPRSLGLPVDPISVSGLDIAGLPDDRPHLPGLNLKPGVGGNELGGVRQPSVRDATGGDAFDGDVTQTLPVFPAPTSPAPVSPAPVSAGPTSAGTRLLPIRPQH